MIPVTITSIKYVLNYSKLLSVSENILFHLVYINVSSSLFDSEREREVGRINGVGIEAIDNQM